MAHLPQSIRFQRFKLLIPMLKKTIITLLGLAGSAHAQTVTWGSSFFQTQVQSDGTSPFNDTDFTFQIGTFHGSVDPTTADANQLAAAWRVMDESGYNPAFVSFDSSATLDANGYSDGLNAEPNYDFRGEKLYIWVYDGNAPATDNVTEECYEWALFTGDWTLPTEATQQNLPLEYRTSPSSDGGPPVPIYGGLNDVHAVDGGTFTDAGTFELQTHEVCLEAIPEPSGALLLLVGAGMIGSRRKRS